MNFLCFRIDLQTNKTYFLLNIANDLIGLVGFANKLCILNTIGSWERQNQLQIILVFPIGVPYTHKLIKQH